MLSNLLVEQKCLLLSQPTDIFFFQRSINPIHAHTPNSKTVCNMYTAIHIFSFSYILMSHIFGICSLITECFFNGAVIARNEKFHLHTVETQTFPSMFIVIFLHSLSISHFSSLRSIFQFVSITSFQCLLLFFFCCRRRRRLRHCCCFSVYYESKVCFESSSQL